MSSDNETAIPHSMRAMVLEQVGKPLVLKTVPVPQPESHQVLIEVISCGVCRTDLHIIDGELPHPKLPLIPGHEIIGKVVQTGSDVRLLTKNDIVGVPWLGYTCGECKYCRRGQENLCDRALFTGYTLNGGYAEYITADERYCFPIAPQYANASGSPLLCAGLIGYRSYKMTGSNTKNLAIYGFGAAAHILIQLAIFQGKSVYAFTRDGDDEAQQFARQLGASWAGGSSQSPPQKADAAIIFAPVGSLVPKALMDADKGAVVVCGGIHMSDIPSFPYYILWEERVVRSIANLTRDDGREFLTLAPKVPIQTETELYPLQGANEALQNLKSGKVRGAAVLAMK